MTEMRDYWGSTGADGESLHLQTTPNHLERPSLPVHGAFVAPIAAGIVPKVDVDGSWLL